jgi:hypothetical protein
VFHRTLDLARTAPCVRILWVLRLVPRVLVTQNPPTFGVRQVEAVVCFLDLLRHG